MLSLKLHVNWEISFKVIVVALLTVNYWRQAYLLNVALKVVYKVNFDVSYRHVFYKSNLYIKKTKNSIKISN